MYTAHVLGTTSRQGIEACQFYPLSLLRVFVLFPYLVTDGVLERSMERSGVRPKKPIRLGRDMENTRLILHSLRLHFAPFKKRTDLQTLAGHTHLFLSGFKNGRK